MQSARYDGFFNIEGSDMREQIDAANGGDTLDITECTHVGGWGSDKDARRVYGDDRSISMAITRALKRGVRLTLEGPEYHGRTERVVVDRNGRKYTRMA